MSSKSITDFLKSLEDKKKELKDLESAYRALFNNNVSITVEVASKSSYSKFTNKDSDFLSSIVDLVIIEIERLKFEIEEKEKIVEVMSRIVR